MSRSGDAADRALRRARANPRQLWLRGVDGAPEGPSQPKLSRSIGTRGRPCKKPPGVFYTSQPPVSVPERFALELELQRMEWAADGGDGSVCSTHEGELRTLDLEWQLRGPLLEAMAAVLLRPGPARDSSARQSECSMEPAA